MFAAEFFFLRLDTLRRSNRLFLQFRWVIAGYYCKMWRVVGRERGEEAEEISWWISFNKVDQGERDHGGDSSVLFWTVQFLVMRYRFIEYKSKLYTCHLLEIVELEFGLIWSKGVYCLRTHEKQRTEKSSRTKVKSLFFNYWRSAATE